MKIDRMLGSLPSKQDLAAAMGLTARTPGTDLLTALGIFSIGIILGAGVGLLFAPTAGDAMRRNLSDKVGDLRNRLRAGSEQPKTSKPEDTRLSSVSPHPRQVGGVV